MVPKLLTPEQKESIMNFCADILNNIDTDPGLLDTYRLPLSRRIALLESLRGDNGIEGPLNFRIPSGIKLQRAPSTTYIKIIDKLKFISKNPKSPNFVK
ncbi:hypothetical protein NQ318_013337 [Aromia moschata]|uniref:Uncharacterized protein n=1 Tax=Aromia moschata TaxID=1265417 RepID=A0AAV8XVC8_9CUCU|nr:hypothetical protein NQ318_013337 [Aromia moschata]